MNQDPQKHEETRPITLFVSRVGEKVPDLEYMKKPRLTVIDVEMDIETTKRLAAMLEEHISTHVTGSIRFRLYGNLVLG